MAATIQTYLQALKTQFLDLLRNQVNVGSGPLYNMIKSTEKNIEAYQVIKSAPYGINGGAGAGPDDGNLPVAGENKYQQFQSSIKNYYGTIRIGDKVMKASKSKKGAFVDAMVAEMEGIKNACTFIYGRDIHLTSSGVLATCEASGGAVTTFGVSDTRYLIEGLTIDILDNAAFTPIQNGQQRRIIGIDRATNTITLEGADQVTTAGTELIVTQGSYNRALTGLNEIFQSTGTLYNVLRDNTPWMVPLMDNAFGVISDAKIQAKIAEIEDFRGGKVNYIGMASDVEGAYMTYLESTRRNVNTMKVSGGYNAIDFKGTPMKRDRFLRLGTMDMLDTTQFTLHVLSDWDWITDVAGNILQPVAGTAAYVGALAKYAELICDHPGAQCRNTGVQ